MRTTTKRLLPLFAATVALGTFGASGAALADNHDGGQGSTTLEAHLTELNDSGASGTAWMTLEGNELTVKLDSSGMLAEAPHAQHIHIGGANECPTRAWRAPVSTEPSAPPMRPIPTAR